MEKNSLFAFNNLNIDTSNKSTVTIKVPVDEAKEYIEAYKSDPINLLGSIKGFHLNSTIINAIKNTPNVESLFLYLAKRTKVPTGYTLVSILASNDTVTGQDTLMIDKIYEWHDSINLHKPNNEDLIGYESTE